MNAATLGTVAVLAGMAGTAVLLAGTRRMRRAFVAAVPQDGPARPDVQPATPAEQALLDEHRAAHFGEPWDFPAVDHAVQVPTPIGQHCGLCGEPIQAGDRGWMRGAMSSSDDGRMVAAVIPHHAECELLTIAGHLWGVCDCYGWDTSRRQAGMFRAAAGRASVRQGSALRVGSWSLVGVSDWRSGRRPGTSVVRFWSSPAPSAPPQRLALPQRLAFLVGHGVLA